MSAKDPRREQKRKEKRARRARKERARKQRQPEVPQPYTGRKYQAEAWVPHVYQTELAIYETIQLSGDRLTNKQVREALVKLIQQLRNGLAPALAEDEPLVQYVPGQEIEFLIANIRAHWRELFREEGPASSKDLIGILRTLLYSIVAHASPASPHRGYVAFLKSFMRGTQD